MEITNDEIELIRFLKRRHFKEALFYLIIGFILLAVSLYLFIDGIVKDKSGTIVIIFGILWIVFLLFIMYLGIKDLVEFFRLKKDFTEMKYMNVLGKPKNVKFIRTPKKRGFPAPVIDDIILYFDNNLKIKYHIMYAYDKHTFDYERIKEDLINYECDYDYLVHSHFVTKYDPELGKCLNKSLKRINIIIKQKK